MTTTAPTAILTSSSLRTFRECPRRYYYRYEIGLAPAQAQHYLRLGSAFHRGLELWALGHSEAEALGGALAGYSAPAPGANEYDWAVERETVQALLTGHFWRYAEADAGVEVLATELPFELELRNPDTDGRSRTFVRRGKIDAIVRLADGRVAVVEYKTAGESVLPESDYWLRLRADAQISEYFVAARALGWDPQTIVYDVTRKPTIGPVRVPQLDADGLKIVLDANGERVMTKQGKPRQTGSAEDGYVLQTDPEAPEAFGERLLKDIGERPDYYYARREVARTDQDIAEFEWDRWQQAEQVRAAMRHGRWYRNVGRFTCANCEFSGICLTNVHVDPAAPPSGYVILDNVHPETEVETQ